jgi:hypothetical protein
MVVYLPIIIHHVTIIVNRIMVCYCKHLNAVWSFALEKKNFIWYINQQGIDLFCFFFESIDQANASLLSNNFVPDAYPIRSNSVAYPPDLSRAQRFDAYLLAIVRIEDKRSKIIEWLKSFLRKLFLFRCFLFGWSCE